MTIKKTIYSNQKIESNQNKNEREGISDEEY